MERAAQWPMYGYRRLTAQLRREGNLVNRQRVRRLMRDLGILGRPAKPPMRTTNSQHGYSRFANFGSNIEVTRPDVADITYVRLLDEFIYLAVVMDVLTRRIRGWAISRSRDQSLTVAALVRALQIGRFLDAVYQHKRIHSALGDLTPAEFEQQWLTLHGSIDEKHPFWGPPNGAQYRMSIYSRAIYECKRGARH